LRRISEEGTTVLVIDHDVPFMFALCGRVTVMNFGHIIASGAPAEISRHSAVRAAYLGGDQEKAAS
jgi:branched-chain amino acid transport system ATP-binding protein